MKAGHKPRFIVVDTEANPIDVSTSGGDISTIDLKHGSTVVVDPNTITQPKKLRAWLVSQGIAVESNAPMVIMKKLIPIPEMIEEDEGIIIAV